MSRDDLYHGIAIITTSRNLCVLSLWHKDIVPITKFIHSTCCASVAELRYLLFTAVPLFVFLISPLTYCADRIIVIGISVGYD